MQFGKYGDLLYFLKQLASLQACSVAIIVIMMISWWKTIAAQPGSWKEGSRLFYELTRR